jgi:hypothetical protein
MTIHRPPLPAFPRQALFAASLSRDLKNIAEVIDGNTTVLRIVSERLFGLPRATNIGAVASILKELGQANIEIEREQRKLREILGELKDFVS